jgi:hypothetical protein
MFKVDLKRSTSVRTSKTLKQKTGKIPFRTGIPLSLM